MLPIGNYNPKNEMKYMTQIKSLYIVLFVLVVSIDICAQDNSSTTLKDFKILVEKTDDGIKMKSLQGSAWINLAFSINDYQPQAVDEYGMASLNNLSSKKDPKLADFLFTITKTDEGIALKGLEGTAWNELSFTLANNSVQAINQNGMTKLN